MKYSQAVLVACTSGAALVSAIPTIGHNAGASRVERYGNRVGKGIAHFRQFADKASGMSTFSNDQGGSSSFKRRNLAITPTKLGGRGPKRAKAKAFAKAVVAGAGGATELAQGLGSAYYLAKQNSGSDPFVARGLPNTETPASTSPSAAQPMSPTAQNPSSHVGGGHHDNNGGRRERNKKHASVAAPLDVSTGKSGPTSPFPAPLSSRDFQEDLWLRAFDDLEFLSSRWPVDMQVKRSHRVPSLSPHESDDFTNLNARDLEEALEARGAWSKVKNAVGALKDTVLGKQSNSAGMPIGAFDPAMAMTKRDYIEDLDARDLDFEIDDLD